MKTFEVPTRDQVTPESQAIFDNLQKGIGMVPNLYATIGYSANALGSYIQFDMAQAKGTFRAKEREAIFLAVSEVNGCQYCLAVHTALGQQNGFSEEETFQLRAGTHPDEKLRTITRLAASITQNRGRVDQEILEQFFALGYDEKALIDLLALVTAKTMANYTHIITQVPIDFPAAKPLPEAVAV